MKCNRLEVMEFNVDSFGDSCPGNWKEIVDYLNDKVLDGMDKTTWKAYGKPTAMVGIPMPRKLNFKKRGILK